MGTLWACSQEHSPFDVIGWTGNYCPFKYDLSRFCAVGSVSYDHIDPSIFTVLTCDSHEPGTPLADFLLFSPRWYVGILSLLLFLSHAWKSHASLSPLILLPILTALVVAQGCRFKHFPSSLHASKCG